LRDRSLYIALTIFLAECALGLTPRGVMFAGVLQAVTLLIFFLAEVDLRAGHWILCVFAPFTVSYVADILFSGF